MAFNGGCQRYELLPVFWILGVDSFIQGLSSTLFALGKLYFLRGSIKSSEFFLQKAQDLSRSLNAPILFSRALGRAAETETHLGRLESGGSLLSQAVESWQAVSICQTLLSFYSTLILRFKVWQHPTWSTSTVFKGIIA